MTLFWILFSDVMLYFLILVKRSYRVRQKLDLSRTLL